MESGERSGMFVVLASRPARVSDEPSCSFNGPMLIERITFQSVALVVLPTHVFSGAVGPYTTPDDLWSDRARRAA
jgi:hypothetical protein